LFKSLTKLFNQPEPENTSQQLEDEIMLFVGLLVEAAEIDGKIDETEILIIKNSIISLYEISDEKVDLIINKCLESAGEPNLLHYFTSKINKEFDYDKKINLLEILWKTILADGQIHDFESNLIRRLSGLMYISNIDCGNVKKRVLLKINQSN
jgi:uncharacterized tellurite resistance protein B-like protein